MILDWIIAIIIFGFIGAIGFAAMLQVVGMLAFIFAQGQQRQPSEQRVSVRVGAYDYDED